MSSSKLVGSIAVVSGIAVGLTWWTLANHDTSDTALSSATSAPASTAPEAAEQSTAQTDVPEMQHQSVSLPAISLLGTSVNSNPAQSLALLKFDGKTDGFTPGAAIYNSGATLIAVNADHIVVNFQQKTYTLRMSNTVSANLQPEQNTAIARLRAKMQAQQAIAATRPDGNRPQSLSQIIAVNHSRPVKKVAPGLNPSLFESAGFLEGDELLSINGVDIELPEFFERVEQEIQSAQTLTFEVERNGRVITLFLDIPSESLKIL